MLDPAVDHPGVDYSEVDFFAGDAVLEDPYPYYEFVRRQGPVWKEPHHGSFLVTGYDEIAAIYRDMETYSSCNSFGGPFTAFPEPVEGDDVTAQIDKHRQTFPNGESFITWDPPEHTSHRGLMMRLLTPKRLHDNEQFMIGLADRQIDAFARDGRCEFLADYAQPVALLVIADLLGVPAEDHGAIRAAFVAHGTPGAVGHKPDETDFLGFLTQWFTRYIEDRRRAPREDVLGQMAAARFPDGTVPSVADVVKVATLLFAGGQGTAARFLGNAMRLLAEHPELQDRLRNEPARIPTFIEEMLRFNSPVKVNSRMNRVTTTLGGVRIPAGSNLVMLLGAGDRDPRRFDCPGEFQADRPNAREHIAFGRGVHSCPGGPLVRAEAQVTISRMLTRLGDIRLSKAHHGPDGTDFTYTPSYILRGVEALHLEFEPES